MDNYRQVKVALVGAAGVGKSSLVSMLNREHVSPLYTSTIGIDLRFVYNHDKRFKIVLWDLSGTPRFKEIVKNYVNSVEVVLFCFAANDTSSYHDVIDLYQRYYDLGYLYDKELLVVATKTDLVQDELHELRGIDLAGKIGAHFIAMSAMTGDGRDNMMLYIDNLLGSESVPERVAFNTEREDFRTPSTFWCSGCTII